MKNKLFPKLLIIMSIVFALLLSACSTSELSKKTTTTTDNDINVAVTKPTQIKEQAVFSGVVTSITLLSTTAIIKVNKGEEIKTFIVGVNTNLLDSFHNKKIDTELSVGCQVNIEYNKADSENLKIQSNSITILSNDGIVTA